MSCRYNPQFVQESSSAAMRARESEKGSPPNRHLIKSESIGENLLEIDPKEILFCRIIFYTCQGQEPNFELLPPTILSPLAISASIGGTPHSETYKKIDLATIDDITSA